MEPVVVEKRIEARPETIFAFLTEPEKYTRWQGVEAELDPRPGGIYRVRMNERTTVRGTYLEVEAPRRVVFTWGWESVVELPDGIAEVGPGSTRVEITLVPDGEATILRVRHEAMPTATAVSMHALGWTLYSERLSAAACGGDPGPEQMTATDPLAELARLAASLPRN